MKLLIVKLGALGDVINTFPLAVNIKEQIDCEITWLVAPLSRPLVEAHSCVDHTIVFDKKKTAASLWQVIRQIRNSPFDITLDLQRILKSGTLALAAKSKRRIGFDKKRCKEMSWIFPFERILPSDPHKHMLEQYLDFLAPLNLDRQSVRWHIPRFDCQIKELPKSEFVVLNIGATKPANLWSPANFAHLADDINTRFNLPVVLTGGKEDMMAAAKIVMASKHPIVNLTGETSIEELVEILARAACVISCDTGPMHLARALDTTVIALFGPSDPQRTGPYQGIFIQKKMACSPCNQKECARPLCMDSITSKDVVEQLEKLINH